MNNHCVPDFEFDDDYSNPCSSRVNKKSTAMAEEEDIMELLCQNGHVVVQSQRSGRKAHDGAAAEAEEAAEETAQQHLFMQEDEMASWLQSPLDESPFDRDIYADLLYPTMSASTAPIKTAPAEIRVLPPPPQEVVVPPRQPVPPASPRVQNFTHFARIPKAAAGKKEPAPSTSSKAVVESNETPAAGTKSRLSVVRNAKCGSMSSNDAAAASVTAKELTTTCEITVTSSPGVSGASFSASMEPPPEGQKQPPKTAEDRKRKGREEVAYEDIEDHSMDLEIESGVVKKQAPGSSSSTKRSRAAEVHNLSERRRRDRINEKMRALQELIPRCNKSDKASMLDEAIEYLKSLQLQVQMMSMGCGTVPMMYPGVQQYMPAMGLGMGMGMGIDMSMTRPMMLYPTILPGSAIPNPTAPAHIAPRFPVPPFPVPPVPVPDLSRTQTPNAPDPMLSYPSQPRHPNFVDPYQQYLGFHHIQVPPPQRQNQGVAQEAPDKPSNAGVDNPENHHSGG